MNRFRRVILLGLLSLPLCASAQWLNYRDPDLPRKDGKFDPAAPTPRMPDGKPDLSGLWSPGSFAQFTTNKQVSLQPWAAELVKQRLARNGVDDPNALCAPTGAVQLWWLPPIKIIQKPKLVTLLYEPLVTYRQIFLDGRPFPENSLPTYMGYSRGRWEGDTLVVESMGFNDKFWIDSDGTPHTEKLRLTERIRRPSFGRLEVELTLDDPGAFTKPFSVRLSIDYLPDSEMMEAYCEDNQYVEQLQRATSESKDQGKAEEPPAKR